MLPGEENFGRYCNVLRRIRTLPAKVLCRRCQPLRAPAAGAKPKHAGHLLLRLARRSRHVAGRRPRRHLCGAQRRQPGAALSARRQRAWCLRRAFSAALGLAVWPNRLANHRARKAEFLGRRREGRNRLGFGRVFLVIHMGKAAAVSSTLDIRLYIHSVCPLVARTTKLVAEDVGVRS